MTRKHMNRNELMKQRSHKYGSNFIVRKSFFNDILLTFESELEYLVYVTTVIDSDVIGIEMHPEIRSIVKADPEDYSVPDGVMDMKVILSGGRIEYWEIKYANEMDPDNDSKSAQRSQKQVALQRAFCEDKGINYRLVTDKDLLAETEYLSNAKYLLSVLEACNRKVVEIQSEGVLKQISITGTITIGELTTFFDPMELFTCIAYLWYKKQIKMDIVNALISYETEVRYDS